MNLPAGQIVQPYSSEGLSSSQSMCLAVLIGFSLGSVGLFALALMVWLSHQRFGIDNSAKHGMSERNASRLGGLAIVLFLSSVWALSSLIDLGIVSLNIGLTLTRVPNYLWPAIAIGLLGLVDDLGFEIAPWRRLAIMLIIGVTSFAADQSLLPNRMLDLVSIKDLWGLSLLGIASSVVLAGFVNAANVADGANGLLSGICLVFFWIAWQLQSQEIFLYLVIVILCFWLINVLTGRIMLGDLGAYMLGALVVYVSFDLFDESNVNPFFLASLLSYPCIELPRVIATRLITGGSPMLADNTHLHNLLNTSVKKFLPGTTLPNSLTGFLIVFSSTMPGCLIYRLDLQESGFINFTVFCMQTLFFLILWRRLKRAYQLT